MGEEKEGSPEPGGGEARGGFKKRDLFLHFQLISVLTYDAPYLLPISFPLCQRKPWPVKLRGETSPGVWVPHLGSGGKER